MRPHMMFNVLEEQPPRTFVGDIKSNLHNITSLHRSMNNNEDDEDDDGGDDDDVVVILKHPNSYPSNLFYISKSDGMLFTKRMLNREVLCSGEEDDEDDAGGYDDDSECFFDLSVSVLDINEMNNKHNNNKRKNKNKQNNENIIVRVNLLDINDNNPTFPTLQHHVTVSEGARVESKFILPLAFDLDASTNPLNYNVTCSTDAFKSEMKKKGKLDESPFGVESKQGGLWLVLKSELDRESIDKYVCKVLAVDEGGKMGEMVVWVDVDDVNDNSPKFDTEVYSVQVSEAFAVGGVLLRVHASDDDDGDNSLVTYKMSESSEAVHGGLFGVNSKNGDVILKDELDREKVESHQFVVKATDSGAVMKNSEFVRVSIKVVDENDNDPVVTVTSFGSDDNPPSSSANYFEIVENSEDEKFVAFLSVSDADEGKNAECICELKSAQEFNEDNTLKEKHSYLSYFKLGAYYEDGYKLETARSLDREKVPFYVIKVECFDQGRPTRTSTTTIHLKVLDVNDNRPTFFEKHVRIEVEEGNEVGKLLATLSAQDDDNVENSNTYYALQSMLDLSQSLKFTHDKDKMLLNPFDLQSTRDDVIFKYGSMADIQDRMNYNVMNLVQLDEKSGHLFALVSFDYERMPSEINYKAIAYESMEKSRDDWSWIPVTLSIIDTNDEKPVFSQSKYTFEISENSQLEENILGQIRATDADITPAFKEINYQLLPSVISSVFHIDKITGILSTQARFDREDKDEYDLVVKAYNPVHSPDPTKTLSFTLVNVTIKITDANDNEPVFTFPRPDNNRVYIGTSHHDVICVVEASDDDEDGANSDILLSIIKEEILVDKNIINNFNEKNFNKDEHQKNSQHPTFEIDKKSGAIRSLRPLTEERTFKLTLLAEDQGSPTLSTITPLYVEVNDTRKGLARLRDVAEVKQEGQWLRIDQSYLLPLLFTLCCVIATILCLGTIIAAAVVCRRRRKKRNRNIDANGDSLAMSNSCYTDKKLLQNSLLTNSTCGNGSGYADIKIHDNWTGTYDENDTWKSMQSIESKHSCCSNYMQRSNFSPTEVALKSNMTTPITTFCQYNTNERCGSRCCSYNSCSSIRSCAVVDEGGCTKCSPSIDVGTKSHKNYESDNHETNKKVGFV